MSTRFSSEKSLLRVFKWLIILLMLWSPIPKSFSFFSENALKYYFFKITYILARNKSGPNTNIPKRPIRE
jgi:hypothetical protein